jgi:hypothetical protein
MAGNKVKIDLVADTSKATSSLKKFTSDGVKGFSNLTKGMSTATKVALGVGAAVVGIGVAVVKLAKFIKEGTDEWAKYNDEIAKSAVQLGVSTDALQEWNFIAERSGVSQSELASAFTLLNRNLAEAADGTAAQADALAKLNLNASQLQGMRLEDSFKLIMERVQGLNTESEKSQVLMDLMGRSGSKLKTVVAAAGDSVSELSARWRELGGAIPEEHLRDAEQYQDTMTDLKIVMKLVGDDIWSVFAPAIRTATELFIKLVTVAREFLGLTLSAQLREQQQALRDMDQEFLRSRGMDTLGITVDELIEGLKAFKKNMIDLRNMSPHIHDWGYGQLAPTDEEQKAANLFWGAYLKSMLDANEFEKALTEHKRKRAEIEQKILDLQIAMGQAPRGKVGAPTPPGAAAPREDKTAAAKEAAALAAMNNARRITISLMEDERAKADALLQEKLIDIELEFNAKVEKHGQYLSFIDEANARELEAKQQHADALDAIEADFWARQQERHQAREEMKTEGLAQEAARQTQIQALMQARDERAWIDLETDLARTGKFYQDKLEMARAAGASEMELEQIKTNFKKDLAMSALQTTMQIAQQHAAQSKNAWRAYKAAAIAQTVISTFKSAQSSYEALAWIPLVGPALGAAAAAAAIIAGFARVQSIRKQERPSAAEGGVFSGPATGYPATLHGTEAVVPLPGGRGIPVEGAGGGTLQVNITATDSQSFTDLVARNPQAIIGPLVEQMQLGNRNLISTMQDTTREE